ncbi:hypothetical protein DOX57_008870 [Cronobacter dublinensis]
MVGVELMGFNKDSDREALDYILQEVGERCQLALIQYVLEIFNL